MGFPGRLTVSLAVLFIVGCSSGHEADPPPSKTVFDPLTQDMQKAKDVQQAVDANTDRTREAVDHPERAENTP